MGVRHVTESEEQWQPARQLTKFSRQNSSTSAVKGSGRNGQDDLNDSKGIGSRRERRGSPGQYPAMGDEADDILRSFGLSADDAKKYDVVKGKFDSHFIKRRNVIYERARFNQRRQEAGESVDCFVTALYGLAEHCEYAALQDEMIRDRIVVGLRDAKLSESLQLDPELAVEKAVTKARQAEAVKQKQPLVRSSSESQSASGSRIHDTSLGAVTHKGRWGKPNSKKPDKDRSPKPSKTCGWCGKSPPHKKARCPAKDAVCQKCKKKGHFKSVCRSVNELHTSSDSESDSDTDTKTFVGVITRGDETPWSITIFVNDTPIDFEIDTGAEVSVISTKTYKEIGSLSLTAPTKSLHGPSSKKLSVKGQFTAALRYGSKVIEQELYVVDKLHKQLLGRPAIEALKVVTRVQRIKGSESPVDRFPQLFKGLGKLEGEYSIQLEEGAVPYALLVPRRVAIPLRKAVNAELQRMEKLGVITRVRQPTKWCAGMVVVPKENGKVRICVDLTHLNRSFLRERHPLPAVEQSLAQLAGAQVFSTFDANSGFWQIPLDRDSALLTTFITPFGRYCFHRLPFGITSAPEHFQRRMSDILSDLEGVVCMMDDVLVHGQTQEEHDQRLDTVLQRMKEVGMILNKDKCHFSQNQVKFLGQLIDREGIHPDNGKVRAIQEFRIPQNVGEIRRFLGMCNHLSKFAPNLADKTKPLRELLNKRDQWVWGEPQRVYSLQGGEGDSNDFTNLSSLRSTTRDGSVSRCILVWTGCRTSAEATRWRAKTNLIHFSIANTNRATLCADREGSSSLHLGMREIYRFSARNGIPHPHGSQAIGPTLWCKESRRITNSSPTISTTNDALQVHDFACSWYKSQSGGCTVQSTMCPPPCPRTFSFSRRRQHM